MNNVKYYQDDFKKKVVQHYLETDDSISKTGKKFNVSRISVGNWISDLRHEFGQADLKKKSKFNNVYSEEFKLEVARHYLETSDGFAKTAKRFNLTSSITIRSWVTKFRGELLISNMNKPVIKDKPALPDNPAAMVQRIRELEGALVTEQLKNTAVNTMIDIAERDLNICIRKKSGAKQSLK